MADEAGGALCGDPDELANALEKIDLAAHRTIMAGAQESSAHMFIISPFAERGKEPLFHSPGNGRPHPPAARAGGKDGDEAVYCVILFTQPKNRLI